MVNIHAFYIKWSGGCVGGFYKRVCQSALPPQVGFALFDVFGIHFWSYIADNHVMNRLNFEDSIFILNMRIRMIKDTLRLTPPPELFMERCLDDLEFVSGILEMLVHTFVDNANPQNGYSEVDFLSDTEWQFTQLLTEFSLESSPFPAQDYPEAIQKIALLRESSNTRRKTIEETIPPAEIAQAEPVVTSAELNGLLGPV